MSVSQSEGIRIVTKGMILLGIITLIEVFIALIGNGHLIHGFYLPKYIIYPAMIGFSLYKAYYIVFEFMHMKYEVKKLAMSVLLPLCLLVWAIIAFLAEGNYWKTSRHQIELLNNVDYHAKPKFDDEHSKHDAETKKLDAGSTH